MQAWLTSVSDVAFPILVTMFLLVRIESKLTSLEAAIRNLAQSIDRKKIEI